MKMNLKNVITRTTFEQQLLLIKKQKKQVLTHPTSNRLPHIFFLYILFNFPLYKGCPDKKEHTKKNNVSSLVQLFGSYAYVPFGHSFLPVKIR